MSGLDFVSGGAARDAIETNDGVGSHSHRGVPLAEQAQGPRRRRDHQEGRRYTTAQPFPKVVAGGDIVWCAQRCCPSLVLDRGRPGRCNDARECPVTGVPRTYRVPPLPAYRSVHGGSTFSP